MIRVLLVGSAGQLGRVLATSLSATDVDLVGLGRGDLDITDGSSIKSTFGNFAPEFLINAAAYTAVDQAELEPGVAASVNEVGTALLENACHKAGVPMLHISTDYVFDGLKDGVYSEDDAVNPLCVYGKTKEAGERALRRCTSQHIILRTSWIFSSQGTNFVKTILALAREKTRLPVVADQFGGPSSAHSVAKAIINVIEKVKSQSDIAWGTYHFCQKPFVSWYQFAEVIVARATTLGLLDHEVKLVPILSSQYSKKVARPANSRLATLRIEQNFNVGPTTWVDDLDKVISQIGGKV